MDRIRPPSEHVKELSAEGEEHLDAMLSMSMTPGEWAKKLLASRREMASVARLTNLA